MKVLLSAFACEPGMGSESEVGWKWAIGLAELGHEVTVLTRSISRPGIERELSKWSGATGTPRFAYFDLPPMMRWESRGPLHIYQIVWQYRAARFAQRLHARAHFDCVHHVTYAGLRSPSFMGRLGIPFILGPVGGGETAPWRLRRGYSPIGWISDMLRDLANLAVRFEPSIIDTIARASRVYVTSGDTLRLLPRRYRHKVAIELAIGSDENMLRAQEEAPRSRVDNTFRVLYAGRFIDVKGMHIGLPAFAKLLRTHSDARLTMVGSGPAERYWRRIADRLGIAARITWLPWQSRADMAATYAEHDVLLFPALHDSGALVVLEAMSHGLPVVCLKLGGPGILVDNSCGRAIDVAGKTRAQVVEALAGALDELTDLGARSMLSGSAYLRCREFSWREKVRRVYGFAS